MADFTNASVTITNGLISDTSGDANTTFTEDIDADNPTGGKTNFDRLDHDIMHIHAPRTTGSINVDIENSTIVADNAVGFRNCLQHGTSGGFTIRNGKYLYGGTTGTHVFSCSQGSGTSTAGSFGFPGTTIGIVGNPDDSTLADGPHFVVNENESNQDGNNFEGTAGVGTTWNLGFRNPKPGIDFGGGSNRGYIHGTVGTPANTGFGNHWCAYWDCDFSAFNTSDVNKTLQFRATEQELWIVNSTDAKIPSAGFSLSASTTNNTYRVKVLTPHQISHATDDGSSSPTDVTFVIRNTGGQTVTAYTKPGTFDDETYPSTINVTNGQTWPSTGILIEHQNEEDTTAPITVDSDDFVTEAGGTVLVISRPSVSAYRGQFFSLSHRRTQELNLEKSALNDDRNATFSDNQEVLWTEDTKFASATTTTSAISNLREAYSVMKRLLVDNQEWTEYADLVESTGEVLDTGAMNVTLSTSVSASSWNPATNTFTLRSAATITDGGTNGFQVIEGTGRWTFGAGISPSGITISCLATIANDNITTRFTIGEAGETTTVISPASNFSWNVDAAGTVRLDPPTGATGDIQFTRSGGSGTLTFGTVNSNTIIIVLTHTFNIAGNGANARLSLYTNATRGSAALTESTATTTSISFISSTSGLSPLGTNGQVVRWVYTRPGKVDQAGSFTVGDTNESITVANTDEGYPSGSTLPAGLAVTPTWNATNSNIDAQITPSTVASEPDDLQVNRFLIEGIKGSTAYNRLIDLRNETQRLRSNSTDSYARFRTADVTFTFDGNSGQAFGYLENIGSNDNSGYNESQTLNIAASSGGGTVDTNIVFAGSPAEFSGSAVEVSVQPIVDDAVSDLAANQRDLADGIQDASRIVPTTITLTNT